MFKYDKLVYKITNESIPWRKIVFITVGNCMYTKDKDKISTSKINNNI